MADFKIGIWGTAKTGKTTYLAMLYHAFHTHSDWVIHGTEDARRFVEKAFEVIIEQHKFPEKSANTDIYEYSIEKTQGNEIRRFVLEFQDAPGELYEMYYDRQRRGTKVAVSQRNTEARESDKTPEQIFSYLKDCDGIMVFLDPAWSENNRASHSYELLLWQLFEELRQKRSSDLQPPLVALCVTKVDGDHELWSKRKIGTCDRHTGETSACSRTCPVYEQIGPHFMTHWLTKLNPRERVKCFAISSIGRIEENEVNISSNEHWERDATPIPPAFSDTDGQVFSSLKEDLLKIPSSVTMMPRSINEPDKIAPYELLSPIEWMLDNLNL